MLDATPFPDQLRPDDRPFGSATAPGDRLAGVKVARQGFEASDGLGSKAAKGELLDAVGKAAF